MDHWGVGLKKALEKDTLQECVKFNLQQLSMVNLVVRRLEMKWQAIVCANHFTLISFSGRSVKKWSECGECKCSATAVIVALADCSQVVQTSSNTI